MYTDLDNLFQNWHARNLEANFASLRRSLFAEMKGPESLRQHAHDLIIKRPAPEEPLKDGKQTPVKEAPGFRCSACNRMLLPGLPF